MISKEEVKHIAELARLGLTEKEIGKYQKELSSVLDYMEKLKKVDVSQIEPIANSKLLNNVMRRDEARPQSVETKRKLIEMAPERQKEYIKVKSVF